MHQSILSLLPFGLGPRQCIGMRLALLEIKMAVAHVLPRIKFAPCDLTPVSLRRSGVSSAGVSSKLPRLSDI